MPQQALRVVMLPLPPGRGGRRQAGQGHQIQRLPQPGFVILGDDFPGGVNFEGGGLALSGQGAIFQGRDVLILAQHLPQRLAVMDPEQQILAQMNVLPLPGEEVDIP